MNGEIMAAREGYHETAAQLIFMAYLQRVVNGGGFIDREFGAGTGRIDVLVRKPYTGPDGKPAFQKEAVELKVRRAKDGDPLAEAWASSTITWTGTISTPGTWSSSTAALQT